MSAERLTQNIASGVAKITNTVAGTLEDTTEYAMADAKKADLQRDTKDVNSGVKQTTDFGIGISDLDHWLKVANDDRPGPHLLEDQIARERV